MAPKYAESCMWAMQKEFHHAVHLWQQRTIEPCFSKITTILLNSYRLNISNYLWWSNSLMLECFSQTREPKPCTEYASLTPSTIITVSLSIYKLNSLCNRGWYVNCLHVLAVHACYLFYWMNLYNMIFNESYVAFHKFVTLELTLRIASLNMGSLEIQCV